MPQLCVNIDHVATIRQARLGREPEPATAAALAEQGGAAGLIMHLREDRRHILDRDIEIVSQTQNSKWNLEMAATEEMQSIALRYKPFSVCLVPEKRQELTTEGGLDVASRVEELRDYLKPIHAAGIGSSLFIDADPAQIDAAKAIGSEYVELHTGHYADAPEGPKREALLKDILAGISHARNLGLKVNLGHGLNYLNIMPFAQVPGICEYSIGHSIISRAIFVGLKQAVRDMVDIIRTFVD